MRKFLCYILCAIMLFVLIACSEESNLLDNETNTNDNHEEVVFEHDNPCIIASSVEGFIDQLSEKSVQSTNQDRIFVKAATDNNLLFENYDVESVYYTLYLDDNGEYNGNISLELYWHETDCELCADYCEKFRLDLIFQEKGTDKEGVAKGYTKIQDADFYMKEISNNKTSYVYIIADQYYCRYVINNDVPEKDLIVDQLALFCENVKNSLESDK